MKIQEIEKSLKRFLKKKGSFSAALLVMFLISGTISLGGVESVTEINGIKGDILVKIKQEREKIKVKIKENKSKISEETAMFDTLVKEWDFYGKPLGQNTQVFFTYDKINNGSGKDRTKEEWSPTIDAVVSSGLSSDVALDKVMAGAGTVIDSTTFRETIKISANIVPLVPEIPVINKDINVNINKPQIGEIGTPNIPVFITPETLEIKTVTVDSVDVPRFNVPTITAPGAVASINVTAPVIPNVNVPGDREISMVAPDAPGGFIPSQITPPKAPGIPVIVPPTLPDFTTSITFDGNHAMSTVFYSDIKNDDFFYKNGLIEMVTITGGEFKIQRPGDDKWHYEFNDYTGVNSFAQGSNAKILIPGETLSTVGVNGTWNLSTTEPKSSIEKLGFQKLVGSSTNSTMVSNANFLYTNTKDSNTLNEFAHLDIHEAAPVAGERIKLLFGTTGLSNQAEIMAAFDDGVKINPSGYATTPNSKVFTWINSGKIVIEGANGIVTNHYDHGPFAGSSYKAMAINTGEIFLVPYKNGTENKDTNNGVFGMSQDGFRIHHVMYNSGIIDSYSLKSFIFLGSGGATRPLSVVNRGEIKLKGENSAGVYIKTNSKNQFEFTTEDFVLGTTGSYNPIEMYGDKNIGLYITATNATNNKGNFAVDIGSTNVGNQVFNTLLHNGLDYTTGDKLTNVNVNPTGGANTNIEGSFGILSSSTLALDSHQIRIYDKTESSVGVTPMDNAILSLGAGNIELNGGTQNIGLYISGTGINTGKIDTIGTVKLAGGFSNMGAYTSGVGNDIQVKKIEGTDLTDSIFLFAGEGSKIVSTEGISMIGKVSVDANSTNKKDSGAAFAMGTNSLITINKVSFDTNVNISVTGAVQTDTGDVLGFALMAGSGGKIEAQNNNIEVLNGSTGIASIGLDSNVDFTGGRLKYDGNGYAVYSDGAGKIDLSGATVELYGKSTAFDLNLDPLAISTIKLDADTKIKVESNDVIVFNLKEANNLNTTGLEASIINAIETATGENLSDLIEAGAGIDKYKTAAVDGGSITVGSLDRTGTGAVGESTAQADGNFYYNRFLGQRLVATTTAGSTISAVLSNGQGEKYNNQVVGFEMNSSSSAVANTEAAIHLIGSTVIADRTELARTGENGGIGLFINYGTVTVDGTSKIEVEMDNRNHINEGGVGVYSVNGSNIKTDGIIEVAGDKSTGIIGMAYREDANGIPIPNEFGTAAVGQGEVNISNTGTITLIGIGSIGIYVDNNNGAGTVSTSKVENSGIIKVGSTNSVGTSVGIYGEKSTISNLGTIEVGNGGVGIYGEKGSIIDALGNINLGSDGIGVILDETSNITATNMILGTSAVGVPDVNGKIGIMYQLSKDEQTPLTPKVIPLSIDSSSLDKAIAIYVEGANIKSTGNLKVGDNGVGLYSKNGIVENTGTIELGTKTSATGMYLQTTAGTAGSISNTGTGKITVGNNTQFGMIGAGAGSTIINSGTIELKVAGSVGIYAQDGATVELSGSNIIFEAGKVGSIGVYTNNATINIAGVVGHSTTNADKNILIYGKNGSTINNIGGLSVDGISSSGTDKTIGIYLDGTDGTTNTYNSRNSLTVTNEAIGIYSKGNITLNFNGTSGTTNELIATGINTTGAFIDGTATLNGNIMSDSGAIGVYGKGGLITLDSSTIITLGATANSTGIYLENGASLSGDLTVNGTNNSIGVYYSGATPVTSNGNMTLTKTVGSGNVVGIFAGGANTVVTNNGNVTGIGSNNVVATMAATGGTLNIGGTITVDGKDSVGAFASEKGKIINKGTINASNASNPLADTTIGMMASSITAGKTASIENESTITGTGSKDVGMYLGTSMGINAGKNSGTVSVVDGIAVYLEGGLNTFDNTGALNVTGNGIGMYLKESGAGQIKNTGTIDLTGTQGKGVYAENAVIDFDVTTTGVAGGIGIYATGELSPGIQGRGTTINSTVTVGDGQIGIYSADANVNLDGATVVAGNKVGSQSSIGIYLKNMVSTPQYTMAGTNVTVGDGIGIYLGNNEMLGTPATQGVNLTLNGVVTTTSGIGIYVPKKSKLTTGTVTLNVGGINGIGVYLAGGEVNLGTGSETLTLGLNGINSTGVYVNGGTLNLGNNIVVTGEGRVATATNGSLNAETILNVGKNSQGLLGSYIKSNAGTPYTITNKLSGVITIREGGAGLVATLGTPPSGITIPHIKLATVINLGTLNVDGHTINNGIKVDSIGIYSEVGDINNIGVINLTGDGGVGISYHGKTISSDIANNGIINLNGTNEIGMYLTGNIGNVTNGTMISTTANNTGIVLAGAVAGTQTTIPNLDLGTISLGTESIGLMLNDIDITASTGTISVNEGSLTKSSIGVYGENSTINGIIDVEVKANGIAYYLKESTTSIDFTMTRVGSGGTYLYAKDSIITVTGDLLVGAGQTGIISEDSSINFATSGSRFNVSDGGIGLILKGGSLGGTLPVIDVTAGTANQYSIGAYYEDLGVITGSLSSVTQTGDYTIAHIFDGTSGAIAPINLGTNGNNQIGIMGKNNSDITVNGIIDVSGDENIGVYADVTSSNSVITGAVKVGASSIRDKSSIGVYVKKGSYTGGALSVGNNSIGIYGEEIGGSFTQAGGIDVADSALGIFVQSNTAGITVTQTGGLQVGNTGSIGIYGSEANISVNSTGVPTIDKVGTGTSIGILSQGLGDVSYTGNMDIANSPAKGSIGIYKNGIGTITTGAGNITVGDAGYGIYSINDTLTRGSSDILNSANMTLGASSIGIYSKGTGVITNSGLLDVGKTTYSNASGDNPTLSYTTNSKNHVNSIGIYSDGGKVVNTGTIKVDEEHSIGVYVSNGSMENRGTINVTNGGLGVYILNNTTASNYGTITVDGMGTSENWRSIGISISNNSIFTNEVGGTIDISGGIGINISALGGVFKNEGTVNLSGGTGIYGGTLNGGTINITGGTGSESETKPSGVGSVNITGDGQVIIGGDYASVGGSLNAAGADITLNGAWIEGTINSNGPLFSGNTVTGEINLLPGFISGEPNTILEGFFNNFTGVTSLPNGITVITSPLYVAKQVGEDLVVVKRPYADLSVGSQFDELEKGLDNLRDIANGNKNDSDILVNLDKYLNGLRGDEFAEETGKAIAETRGDIYGTIQGRMQDVNRAFDNSFDELLNSYNPSRQSDKFSVLYTEGDFKDPTVGISDYDYDVKGLLYMHEKEGLKYGTKYGYTLGFTGSTFKFDDDTAGSSGSEEDIYSLRVGAHREQKLGTSKFTWLTRGELAYNYHDTERNMQIGPEKYDNEAGYSSYGASFKNELSYKAYSTLSTDLKVYGGANLEYGAMEGFTEKTGSKGGLELEVKGNDYFIGELEAGLKGSKKIYLGKNINLKVSADAGYAYDLGDNYPGNKAKLKNGGEGYYDLITTEKAEGSLRGKVGLGLEKANHYGVTFEVEWNKRDNRSDEDIKYSARLNYKF